MSTIYHNLAYIGFTAAVLSFSASTMASDMGNMHSYQHNALLSPSSSQLAREEKGFVYIYDGLTNRTIDQAMDTQPERIKSMMFVNTKKTDRKGEVLQEDDDC